MKLFRSSLILGTLGLLLVSAAYADAPRQEVKKEAPGKKEAVKLVNQTVCPVMGGKIDSTIYTDIQGQRVYHCCPMCSKKLKADPDTYFKKTAKAGILFENIQTTCPVSGEPLEEKTVFTDYEGRRVYFCCKKCRGTFADAPDKYLQKMDQPAKKTVKTKKVEDKHQGRDQH